MEREIPPWEAELVRVLEEHLKGRDQNSVVESHVPEFGVTAVLTCSGKRWSVLGTRGMQGMIERGMTGLAWKHVTIHSSGFDRRMSFSWVRVGPPGRNPWPLIFLYEGRLEQQVAAPLLDTQERAPLPPSSGLGPIRTGLDMQADYE